MKRVTDLYKEDTFYRIVQTLTINEVSLRIYKCNQYCNVSYFCSTGLFVSSGSAFCL